MEEFFTVFTGILSALICVIKFYFDLKKNSTKISLKEKYYRKILIPFYVKYKKKKNSGDFCKEFINKKIPECDRMAFGEAFCGFISRGNP